MTDEGHPPDNFGGRDEQAGHQVFEGDVILRSLAWLVDQSDRKGGRFPVTLTVGGLVITGWLASGREYLDYLGERISVDLPSEVDKEGVLRVFHEHAAQQYPSHQEGRGSGAVVLGLKGIVHVHLRDAQILHPDGSQTPGMDGGWWRGRLDSIDGFFYGVIEPA